MSLILDALNKADRERDPRDSVPDINTVHGGIQRPVDHRHLLWIAAALGGLVVILLLLLLVLWLRKPAPAEAALERGPAAQQDSTPQPLVATPPATPELPPPVAPITEVAAAPVLNPEIQALYGVQTDSVVQQVVEPQVQPAPQIVIPETPRQSTVDETLARTLWEESKTKPLPPPVPQPQAATKKPAEPPPAIDSDLSVEETMAGYAKTPFLHELPVSVQDTIPTLMYAKHDYENNKVVINKTELRMGDATNGGVLIERVLADGLLLSFNGLEFKLASLSSWVNY
jgi:general secretion pathway protein B